MEGSVMARALGSERENDGPDQARYFDALLAEMDRELRPELVSDKSRFAYTALRRVFVRLIARSQGASPYGELGAAASVGVETMSMLQLRASALVEGAALGEIEAAVDLRHARTDEPGRGSNSVDAEMVQSYLRTHGHPSAVMTAFRLLAGGRSKQTVLFAASGLEGLPGDLVIRRDLHAGATGTTVIDEFRLLGALADRGAPVPRPYLLERDGGPLGMPFMIMQRVAGALRGDIMTPPGSEAAVLDSARALGRLHALPATELAPAFAATARGTPGDALLGDVIALRDAWNAAARDESATVALAFRWLIEHAPEIPPMTAVVHGDYSYHNLLFEGDVLTAVLDWELGHIGHPAEDLGYIQSVASSVVPWDVFMAAYLGAGGQPAAPITVAFYALLGTLRLMALMHRARSVFESGLTDDLQLAEVVLFHLPKFVHKLSLELGRALALSE